MRPQVTESNETARTPERRQTTLQSGVVMTRPAADGTGAGWHRASSDQGGFSVELPLASQRYRLDAPDKIQDTVVGSSPNHDLVYTVSCFQRKGASGGGPLPIAESAERYRKAFASEAAVTTVPCPPPWTRCLEVAGQTQHARFYRAADRNCSVTLGAFQDAALPAAGDRIRIFESLELTEGS